MNIKMDNKKPTVSIIIPIYNTEKKLISKCVNSLIDQSYNNFEIILVDDGSDKEIAVFLDSLTEEPRINIVHQVNSGVSEARNTGIRYAKGKYFAFFDADDYCSKNYIERLVEAAERDNSDLCIGEFILISDETNEEISRSINKYGCSLDVDDSSRLAIMNQTFHYVSSEISLLDAPYICSTNDFWLQGKVWGKLYKTDFYKDIFFIKGITISEDAIYTIDVLKKTKKISFVKNAKYYYFINSGSASRSKKNLNGKEILFISMKEKLAEYPIVFEGMYSALMFGMIRGAIENWGLWQGYKKIKEFCLLQEISNINKNLSTKGVANNQEKRTRMCLKYNLYFFISLISKLGILKEKSRRL